MDPVQFLNECTHVLKIVFFIVCGIAVLVVAFVKFLYAPGGSIKEGLRQLFEAIMDLFTK